MRNLIFFVYLIIPPDGKDVEYCRNIDMTKTQQLCEYVEMLNNRSFSSYSECLSFVETQGRNKDKMVCLSIDKD